MNSEEKTAESDPEPRSIEAWLAWISRELRRQFDRNEARFEANFNEVIGRFAQIHGCLDRIEQQSRIAIETVHRIEAMLLARHETQ